MKLGLFFGAGAEVGYGLPSGGKFAIDLFRQDVSEHKQSLREQLQQINERSNYATDWLPERYGTQRIHAFGKNEFTSLIESSIEYRKSEIIRRLNDFDAEADRAMDDLGIEKALIMRRFEEVLGSQYGEELYAHAVRMNPLIANEVRLFGTEFYSAILDCIRQGDDSADLQRYAASFLQLLVGAHGQDLVQRLNQELFEAAPDDIPIFDDISGMFRLEFSRAGLTALELLLEERRTFQVDGDAPLNDLLCAVAQQVLENIFTTVLDYQSLIDSHFRYLYSPKTEWAKFTKMVVFLRATRTYIVNQLLAAGELPGQGYYHDLMRCGEIDIEISAVGTANYNNLIESISEQLGLDIPEVMHLNGSVNDYYDPYKNSVITVDSSETVPSDHVLVPFILTQSGLKPLTSVDMSRRYVGLFDSLRESDAIAVIGYGFNIDDSHINGLFRKLIEEFGKTLYWVCLENDGEAETQKRLLVKKLRISAASRDKVCVLPVAAGSRTSRDNLWIDLISSHWQRSLSV